MRVFFVYSFAVFEKFGSFLLEIFMGFEFTTSSICITSYPEFFTSQHELHFFLSFPKMVFL